MKSAIEKKERKIRMLRKITNGKPFSTKDLPDDIHSQLGYKGRGCVLVLLRSLLTDGNQRRRYLESNGHSKYIWVNQAKSNGEEPKELTSAPHVAKNLTIDEQVALDVLKEILDRSQNGSTRLVPSMLALNPKEFYDFIEKMEQIKVLFKIGENSHTNHSVWSVSRNKFNEFYKIAQDVKSGKYEFPPSDEGPIEAMPGLAKTKFSAMEKRLVSMYKQAKRDILVKDKKIEGLESKMKQAKEERAAAIKCRNLFRRELNKLRDK